MVHLVLDGRFWPHSPRVFFGTVMLVLAIYRKHLTDHSELSVYLELWAVFNHSNVTMS